MLIVICFPQESCLEKLNRLIYATSDSIYFNLRSFIFSFYSVFSKHITFGKNMPIIKTFKNVGEETNDDSLVMTGFTKLSRGKEFIVNSSKHTRSSISFIFMRFSSFL